MSCRVMMVDDNDNDLLFTRLMLQRSGVDYEVQAFERAEQALRHLSETPDHGVSLILLDINMPVMNGFAFLAAFEALPPARREGVSVLPRRPVCVREGLPDQAPGQDHRRRPDALPARLRAHAPAPVRLAHPLNWGVRTPFFPVWAGTGAASMPRVLRSPVSRAGACVDGPAGSEGNHD